MTFTLTPDQIVSLRELVQAGDFASVEEAARHLLDERLGELEIAQDDLGWAKPLVDEARAAVAEGKIVPLQVLQDEMTALMVKLGSS